MDAGRGGGARAARRVGERREPHVDPCRRPPARARGTRSARRQPPARGDALSRRVGRAWRRWPALSVSRPRGRAMRALVAFGPRTFLASPRSRRRVDRGIPSCVSIVGRDHLWCGSQRFAFGAGRLSISLRDGGRSETAGRARQRMRGTIAALQIAVALVVSGGIGAAAAHLSSPVPGASGFRRDQRDDVLDAAAVRALRERFDVRELFRSIDGVRRPATGRSRRWRHDAVAAWRRGNESAVVPRRWRRTNGVVADRHDRRRLFRDDEHSVTCRSRLQPTWCAARRRRHHQSARRDRLCGTIRRGRPRSGKRLGMAPSGPTYTVIGVVGDVRDRDLATAPSATVYLPQATADRYRWSRARCATHDGARRKDRRAADDHRRTREADRARSRSDACRPTMNRR